MVTCLARLVLITLIVLAGQPAIAGHHVRPPGAPTPQEIARAQEHRNSDDKTNDSPEFQIELRAAIDWVAAAVVWLWRALNENLGVITLVFTGALVWFTRRLSHVTNKVARAANQSASTAADAFTKLERPWVLISGVTKFECPRIQVGQFGASILEAPRLFFTVGNYGKSPATIEDFQIGFNIGDEPEPPLRADESSDLLQRRIMGPGEIRDRLYELVPDYVELASQEDPRPRLAQGEDLFLWITVLYRGAFTRNHATSTCFIWYRPENCFIRYGQDGGDYNYIQ